MSAIPNPLINIVLQGRHDTYPKRRGMTRVPEMIKAGIRVGFGQDCVLDPWYSLGTADMLDVAFMGLHVAQMTSPADMRRCFDMVTSVNAAIMGLDGYGLAVGKPGQPRRARRRQPDRGDQAAARAALRHRQGQDRRDAPAPGYARCRCPAGPEQVNRRHQAGRLGLEHRTERAPQRGCRNRRLVWEVRLRSGALSRSRPAQLAPSRAAGSRHRSSPRRPARQASAFRRRGPPAAAASSRSESKTRTYWTSSTITTPSPGICMVRCLPSLHDHRRFELPSGHACSRQSTSRNQVFWLLAKDIR